MLKLDILLQIQFLPRKHPLLNGENIEDELCCLLDHLLLHIFIYLLL